MEDPGRDLLARADVEEAAPVAVLARPKLAERLAQLCLVQALPQVVPRRAVPLVYVAAAACLAVPSTPAAPSVSVEVHRAVTPVDSPSTPTSASTVVVVVVVSFL